MIKWTKIAAVVVSSASLAGAASADLIAGWDFSQYAQDGTLDSGAGPADTLSANYSSLVPGGAGTSASVAGTLFMDGTNGSSAVAPLATGSDVVAHANDTKANRKAPLTLSVSGGPLNVFDALNTLSGDGQVNTSRSALTARAPVDLVFQADQGAVAERTWQLSFAGFAINPTGSVDVDVEFATDCSSYSFVDTVTLTADEQAFELFLAPLVTDDEVCVRLSLDDTNGQPVIDNVAVPEPGMVSMLVAGALALLGLERRRRA